MSKYTIYCWLVFNDQILQITRDWVFALATKLIYTHNWVFEVGCGIDQIGNGQARYCVALLVTTTTSPNVHGTSWKPVAIPRPESLFVGCDSEIAMVAQVAVRCIPMYQGLAVEHTTEWENCPASYECSVMGRTTEVVYIIGIVMYDSDIDRTLLRSSRCSFREHPRASKQGIRSAESLIDIKILLYCLPEIEYASIMFTLRAWCWATARFATERLLFSQKITSVHSSLVSCTALD